MLRVTRIEEPGCVQLRLEGRLATLWVGLVRELVELHRRESHTPLALELSAVDFADIDGVALLGDLRRQDVILQGVPGHISLAIRGASPS